MGGAGEVGGGTGSWSDGASQLAAARDKRAGKKVRRWFGREEGGSGRFLMKLRTYRTAREGGMLGGLQAVGGTGSLASASRRRSLARPAEEEEDGFGSLGPRRSAPYRDASCRSLFYNWL